MTRQKMDYDLYQQRLAYLEDMVSKGRLHSLSQAAGSFDCSERTIKRMLSRLRNKGIFVKYSPTLGKFLIDIKGHK